MSCGKPPFLNKHKDSKENSSSLIFNIENGYSFSLNWLTEKSTTTEGRLVVVISRNGVLDPLENQEFKAYLFMKSMGHGSSPIKITKLSDGIYLLEEIYFIMTGPWELHLALSDSYDLEIPLTITK